ncbi:hypothetical protein [Amycolatopsis vancoresmycina]|uniref:Uncharacterized protein n=1 Tax=Amycolatopsis vancoresmycina DSM 44592 TaxID=1292037 RepID=R1HR93_9PSEU|nr:hypothetical protein [Amycolatopsis vancoresmycina]EOD60849.1 hypothetical protein H480_40655 [Amycolatopsis vancoresmycina DSM 44592]
MTTEANAEQEPQPQALPMSEFAQQPIRRKRKPLLLFAAASIVVVLVTVLTVVLTTAGSTAVNGTLTLLCDMQCTKSTADGYDGYTDLSDGSQVTLVNESGRVVATTELHRTPGEQTKIVAGMWVRTFTFTFADVPSAERYGVHVGNNNRGTLWKDADEAERAGFQLSLGS